MSVFKRGKNYYLYLIANGRRYRKSLKTSSKRVALQVEADLKAKMAKGEFLGVFEERILFEDFAEKYLDFSRIHKAPQSYRRDITSLKANLIPYFKGRYLDQLFPEAMEAYKARRLDKVKPATLNRELACVRHMLNKAVQWRHLRTNPMKDVKLLKMPPGRTRYLEIEEIERLLNECPPNIAPIVVCALNTGMRRSEILNLKWRNVSPDFRRILVERTKNNEPKTLPVNGILQEELRNLPRYGEYVFSKLDGTPYKDIKKSFNSAVKRAGIMNFRFNDLRHTFASHLVMSGAGLQTVKELLGHKDVKMTMRYSHLSMSYKQQAVNELGARINLGGKSKCAPYTPQKGHSETVDDENH